MDDTMGISIETATYAYGESVALEDVSLAIDPGTFMAPGSSINILWVSTLESLLAASS
jgi:ABC-type multidrug transport system fused ATPase/permease subunit